MRNPYGFFPFAGAAYIMYLAIHILLSTNKEQKENAIKGCNFWTGFFVQTTNVKVMVFCLTALTSYVLPYSDSFWMLLFISMLLPFIGPVTNLAWIFTGVMLQRILEHEKIMNFIMAAALVLCAFSLVALRYCCNKQIYDCI